VCEHPAEPTQVGPIRGAEARFRCELPQGRGTPVRHFKRVVVRPPKEHHHHQRVRHWQVAFRDRLLSPVPVHGSPPMSVPPGTVNRGVVRVLSRSVAVWWRLSFLAGPLLLMRLRLPWASSLLGPWCLRGRRPRPAATPTRSRDAQPRAADPATPPDLSCTTHASFRWCRAMASACM
jgi:hypothetical protein